MVHVNELEEAEIRERHFAEELALLLEEQGGQRMVGRVLGRLLFCDPPHQTAAQISDYLMVSRGSISTATRSMLTAGLIERHSFPGDRATYFRIKEGAWTRSIEAQSIQLRMMRELAERAKRLAEHHDDAVQRRVGEFHDFFAFWERELPRLLERWHEQRGSE